MDNQTFGLTADQKPVVPQATCGRIVHYYPGVDAICSHNSAHKVPAIVVQAFGIKLNLSVFPMNPDATQVLRYSVPHKSEITSEDQPHWDWPSRD